MGRESAVPNTMHPKMPGGNVQGNQTAVGVVNRPKTRKRQNKNRRLYNQDGCLASMSVNKASDLIRKHEGWADHVYRDSVGVLTCGIGHALHEGSQVPPSVVEAFFQQDMRNTIDDYLLLKFQLDDVRRAVILNMLFNLGLNRFAKFKRLIKALRAEQWAECKKEMLDSIWADQVGKRATELAEMMHTGEWPDE